MTDNIIAEFIIQKKQTEEELEALYQSLLTTAKELLAEDNLWENVAAVLGADTLTGVQFVYPHWDEDSPGSEDAAWDTLTEHIKDTECPGVIVSRLTETSNIPHNDAVPARTTSPTLVFTLLGPGIARTYLHPIEDDHFLPTEGPYNSNMSNIYPFDHLS